MKSIKLIKTRTAIIILVILVILIMFAIFLNVEKFYQKEYESFPTISIYYKDKIIGTMCPTSYIWTYNGQTQQNNVERLNDYNFSEENIIFRHRASNFNTIVETKVIYNRLTKKITLNEIYANNAYSNRAQFVTKGEGTCSETPIERKPVFR